MNFYIEMAVMIFNKGRLLPVYKLIEVNLNYPPEYNLLGVTVYSTELKCGFCGCPKFCVI